MACRTDWDGLEHVTWCEIGISEDEAYHDGDWYCRFNQRTINKRLSDEKKNVTN